MGDNESFHERGFTFDLIVFGTINDSGIFQLGRQFAKGVPKRNEDLLLLSQTKGEDLPANRKRMPITHCKQDA